MVYAFNNDVFSRTYILVHATPDRRRNVQVITLNTNVINFLVNLGRGRHLEGASASA